MDHPKMLDGTTHLVATDKAGNALYGFRNFRMGGRHFTLRTPDGTTKSWNTWAVKNRPKRPPAGGRWKWNDMKELFA